MRFGGWNMLNKISADVSRLLVFWNTCWPPVGTKSLHFLLRWLKAALLAGKLRRRQQRRRRKEIFGLKKLSVFKAVQLGDITQKNKEKERKKKRTPCVHSPRKTPHVLKTRCDAPIISARPLLTARHFRWKGWKRRCTPAHETACAFKTM